MHARADAAVFTIDASGTLQINTGDQTQLGIAPHSFYLNVTGKIELLKVINFNASLTIQVSGGGWSLNANASMSFFGIATLGGSLYLNSDGDFSLSLSGNVTIGSSDFGLSGNFWFQVSSTHYIKPCPSAHNCDSATYYRFELGGGASVNVNAFGFSIAGVSLSFDFSADSGSSTNGRTPIVLHLDIGIHLLFFTIHIHPSFTIGYLQLPPPVYLAGQLTSAKAWDAARRRAPRRRSTSTSATARARATSAIRATTTATSSSRLEVCPAM